MTDAFAKKFEEKAEFNQYWYSPFTIQKMADEVVSLGGSSAFLSTPSIYYSIPEAERANCHLFDFDKGFASDPRFHFYDFNLPNEVPHELLHSFDVVIIDPPFITEEVWRRYAVTAHLLLKEKGKVILTTIVENSHLLQELFGANPTAFQPSIPSLVYQYNLFTNYESSIFSHLNPEIPL